MELNELWKKQDCLFQLSSFVRKILGHLQLDSTNTISALNMTIYNMAVQVKKVGKIMFFSNRWK